jgi:phosphatidylglycerol:prolipoprotein diacylglycerol transferase
MLPRLFNIFGFPIHTYGILLAVGFLVALRDAMRRGERAGVPRETILDLGIWILLASIVGGKLLLVGISWHYYFEDPRRLLDTLRSAGVFYGGFFLSLVVAVWFIKRHGLSFFKVADVLAPSVPLGQFFARLGCFTAGCCYGKECDLPWAVTFRSLYSHENTGVTLNRALHPTQLYLAAVGLGLWLFLRYLFRKRKFDGQIFLTYLMVYGVLRFWIEFYRADERGMWFHQTVSTSQVIAIPVVLAAAVLFLFLRRKAKPSGT